MQSHARRYNYYGGYIVKKETSRGSLTAIFNDVAHPLVAKMAMTSLRVNYKRLGFLSGK